MAEIKTLGGNAVLVSTEDRETLLAFKWRLTDSGYIYTNMLCSDGLRHHVRMHRLILGLSFKDGKIVDHINGNKLDNRRENLRVCTHAENMRNQRKSKSNTSGFKGVHWSTAAKKWVAKLKVNGKIKHLGVYETAEAGHAAYCKAARELHGAFARFE